MSTLEPQTTAKIRLETTKGNIDIELWAKETPKTSRIFLENILNQRFTHWTFNRILKNFIVQSDGSLNQELFEDEINSRIRFNKRGIVGSVNMNSKDSNNGCFFITLKETPELNNKNTAFGKIVGDSIFNILKISEGQLNEDGETPLYPVKILKTEVLIPYFDDLKLDKNDNESQEIKLKEKKKSKKKNKVKLRLTDDIDDVELEIKMKSAHDLLKDKKFSTKSIAQETSYKEKEQLEKKEEEEIIEKPIEQLDEDNQQELKVVEKEEEKLQDEISIKDSILPKDQKQRELQTLQLLKSFQSTLSEKSIKKESKEKNVKTTAKKDDSILDVYDEDFDNLDSDSDSDSDIFSHSLRFQDNKDNSKLENEDLLITIDGRENQKLKRGVEEFYKNEQVDSILSKKIKR